MKLYAVAFSDRGRQLIKKIENIPLAVDYGNIPLLCGGKIVQAPLRVCQRNQENPGTKQLTQRAVEMKQLIQEGLGAHQAFAEGAPLVFVGAAGIAVRALAALPKNKGTDSPVLVVDEQANFVIPLLSGHLGGANELAIQLAKGLGATPVITTATDVNGLFSVDVFARKNNLSIPDTGGIVKISSRLLHGEKVQMAIENLEQEQLQQLGAPMEVVLVPWSKRQEAEPEIVISSNEADFTEAVLGLKFRDYVLGVGCKKGKSVEELADWLEKTEHDGILKREHIAAIASIDVKRGEPGLLELAQRLRRPFYVFSGEELMAVPGDYTVSAFVEQTVGVDTVCERAAVAAAGGGPLVVKKMAYNGMTFAVAKMSVECRKKRSVRFDG